MQEVWKPVVGYEGIYEVSNLGRVKSLPRPYSKSKYKFFLKPSISHGYAYFCLTKNRIEKRIQGHRLVANAFIPNPGNKRCVNHIDGNKSNNVATNLEWNTYSENMSHAIKTGLKLAQKGSKSSGAKLNEREITEIQDLVKCKLFTQLEIGNFYGVSFQTVSIIKLNKLWTHVERECIDKNAGNIHIRGELNPSAKLTLNEVMQIRDLIKSGIFTQREIADHYKVSSSMISSIKLNKTWANI